VWLIAEREFRTYAATASFWIALAVGPLAIAGAAALTSVASAPVPIAVHAEEPTLVLSAATALADAARAEERRFVLAQAETRNSLSLVRAAGGEVRARFSDGFPLSPSGRALVVRTLERDEAVRRLAVAGAPPIAGLASEEIVSRSPTGPDAGSLSRFALMMILWLTLTGSLGMLLQAVVRERANRALESLLAAARPWEIVAGKLAGVGAVSALVLAVWLGAAAGLAGLGASGDGRVQGVFASLAAPATLVRAGFLYVLTYSLYGLVTVALGSMARDVAEAQNYSRPMFAVLLVAFFGALTSISGDVTGLAWLLYVPPFAPFVLLLHAPEDISATSQLCAVGLTLAATAVAGRLATGCLTLSGPAGVSAIRFSRNSVKATA